MKNPDEIKIIKTFQNRFGRKSKFQADDIEIIKIGNSKFVVKSDMLVQGTDVPEGMKLDEVARKSLVACVSDFACKGIKPVFCTIAIAIPQGFTQKMVNELASGFLRSSKEFGLHIIGGDTNEGKELVIEVSMFGPSSKKIPSRGNARVGDIIVTSGPFGYSSAGLKIILNGYKTSSQSAKIFRKAIFRPSPRLAFGLKAAKYFSSSMDSSDGLAITLDDMSRQSKKKFVITSLPTVNDIVKFAHQNKMNLKDLVFCGGEEYEIVFTIHPRDLNKVKSLAKKTNTPLFEIGHVSIGRNVILVDDGRSKAIKRCGWTHLRS
ncbi:MAG: thiamine-phosphate kinase [Thaumarchaeota archaeon]|nr:thiamine-phosphate kinase [Nitrososphaerota archaeon]